MSRLAGCASREPALREFDDARATKSPRGAKPPVRASDEVASPPSVRSTEATPRTERSEVSGGGGSRTC